MADLVGEAHHRARPAPEFFEPVVGALVGRKDVHNEVAEVEQHPAVIAAALAMAQLNAIGEELLFKVVLEGTKLERRLRGGDHEEVGERSRPGDIDQRDIERLVVGEDIDSPLGE